MRRVVVVGLFALLILSCQSRAESPSDETARWRELAIGAGRELQARTNELELAKTLIGVLKRNVEISEELIALQGNLITKQKALIAESSRQINAHSQFADAILQVTEQDTSTLARQKRLPLTALRWRLRSSTLSRVQAMKKLLEQTNKIEGGPVKTARY